MNTPLNLHAVVNRKPGLLSQPLDADLVMADLDSGNYFGLGTTGKRIWELIEQPLQVGALCRLLEAEYDIDPASCEQQVLAFLDELRREGLLQVQG